MSNKILMKGNEAMAEAAIIAECKHYFGYPITPQNEVAAYMSKRLADINGVFLQAESEVSAINMVFGASAAGARVMTSSSSPGVSLKQEGISYLAAGSLPCVIANIMRAGPGLGNITPSQADYFQSTKGGGHGDYKLICLAPNSVQEMADLTVLAFDLSDKYLVPALIVSDGMIGQMIEAIELPVYKKPKDLPEKDWALTGAKKRNRNIARTLWLYPEDGVEQNNLMLQERYRVIEKNETRYEEYMLEDAEYVFTAFGITSRICKGTVDELRKNGIKAGLFRPVTIWPFPYKRIEKLANKDNVKFIFNVELNAGQMLEDVKLAVGDKKPVHHYGRFGGYVPGTKELINEFNKYV
jgi:2-oxoglutarate ferredoxin oxidoreductase subunit alpha